MIEYIEVRGDDTNIIGIVDVTTSVIWRSVYFGVGDFEIHAPAQPEIVSLLQAGRYITRPNNNEVGVIEKIYLPESTDGGATITASGRFVKSILDRRLIYNLTGSSNKATILRGNVENAVREVVKNNAIDCPFDSKRNLSLFALGEVANIPLNIVDDNGKAAEKQVSYENLLTYTDGVLEEYGIGAKCILQGNKFLYSVYSGINRSIDNGVNMPIVFSKDFDNLTSSEYTYDESTEKNVALIGGEGEGVDRFYSLLEKSESDLQRREIFIDAASIKKTVKSSELIEMFPTGTFLQQYFMVGASLYATLVFAESDKDKEYTLKTLQEKFPTGKVSGTKFVVNALTYANKIYGDDENYKLTLLGYKGLLDVDEKEGDYLISDQVYTSLLNSKGKQDIAPLVKTVTFNGTLDVTNGNYVYGRDFALGDIVTVQNSYSVVHIYRVAVL